MKTLAGPEVSPEMSHQDWQVHQVFHQRARLPGEPSVVSIDISEDSSPGLYLGRLCCVPLVTGEEWKEDCDSLAAVGTRHGSQRGGPSPDLQDTVTTVLRYHSQL